MEYVLSVVIIILLINQNNIFKSKIKTLTDSIQKLSSKLDALSTQQNTQSKKSAITSSEIKKPIPSEAKEKPINTLLNVSEFKQKEVTPVADTNSTKTTTVKKVPEKSSEIKKTITVSKQPNKPQIKPPKPSLWERFKEKNPDLEKFIGENLINKLGILILVLGISYFVKYAIDKDWINEPARVGIGVLAGSLVLGIAHKLRKKYASFSSVLVAGAIAIFYFTIAIAFHEYQLFNQTIAFVIMVLITAFSCFLSLSYNRKELAILSLIGGFAAPFMVSTGSGNYQVLFSYIAILDIGILAIAYFKKWSLVNTLAFIFTNLLFISWLAKSSFEIEVVPYKGAFFFAFIFYIIFVFTNIINNLRTQGEFTKTQLSLLAINSFVFYGIGMFILSNYNPELSGLFTACLALLNLLYAWFLYKKFGLDKTAVYLLIGLTLTFITLAIPIQFKGNYITLFWAGEAVLLMWLAQKSKIKSYRFSSVIVHVLMAISLILDWQEIYANSDSLPLILNRIFITGIVSAASLFGVKHLLRKETVVVDLFKIKFNSVTYKNTVSTLFVLLLYIVGFLEISYQSLETYKETAAFISQLPYWELKENIIRGEGTAVAYLLHFIALAFLIYFGWLLYKTNKEKVVFKIFNKKATIWIIAGLIIFITSSELILEALVIGNPEITTAQLIELKNGTNRELDYYEKYTVGTANIKRLKFKIIKTGLPVLWGVLSFLFLILGIRKQIQPLRIAALTLLGITILKLFTYDISNVSETGKIIAFILLGVLILIISFVYQKIKILVIDDPNENFRQQRS